MRYVAAYLLATLGGNKTPSAYDIEKILSSVGIEVDNERVKKVIQELNGRDINEVIELGKSKLASMPSGGAAAATAVGDVLTTTSTAELPSSPAKDGAKKEEKKEESEESDDDMGFGLFD
ncbi:60S acidic ribosomal protein P2-like [Centruroides sculpturatus]|uniref:60S acidic ribosomal protein P2-like n=1 Tax=Centruroides sculpturatus TaxID=218467 RepID=UPI000C6DF601|nr:60S acidic ribosomal protein P2-like [Centruroides sculpturatus]